MKKLGSDILSRFLRRLQKTAGFGTKATVGKAVIRQAFIRQMPPSVHAHLATQPDSASLKNLAMLADRATRDSNSQGNTEEDIRTLTSKRELCRQDTVRSECASKTVCTQ